MLPVFQHFPDIVPVNKTTQSNLLNGKQVLYFYVQSLCFRKYLLKTKTNFILRFVSMKTNSKTLFTLSRNGIKFKSD